MAFIQELIKYNIGISLNFLVIPRFVLQEITLVILIALYCVIQARATNTSIALMKTSVEIR